jgi:hypothetical protein
MRKLFKCDTKVGPFYIAESNRRFHPLFEEESLGSYASAAQAADDLAGGHTFTPANGVDTSTLGIPSDLAAWERIS